MVWVIAFGELFFGDLWCVVWGYGGMRTHFSLLNPTYARGIGSACAHVDELFTCGQAIAHRYVNTSSTGEGRSGESSRELEFSCLFVREADAKFAFPPTCKPHPHLQTAPAPANRTRKPHPQTTTGIGTHEPAHPRATPKP